MVVSCAGVVVVDCSGIEDVDVVDCSGIEDDDVVGEPVVVVATTVVEVVSSGSVVSVGSVVVSQFSGSGTTKVSLKGASSVSSQSARKSITSPDLTTRLMC